jgi:hypothetical protein
MRGSARLPQFHRGGMDCRLGAAAGCGLPLGYERISLQHMPEIDVVFGMMAERPLSGTGLWRVRDSIP